MCSAGLLCRILVLGFSLVLGACEGSFPALSEPVPVRMPASVSYLLYFGPPPRSVGARVEALVGFLPRIDDPARLSPFPLFLPVSSNQLLHLADQVIKMEDDLAATMGLVNPFPQGTRIQSIRRDGAALHVDLSLQATRQPNPVLRMAMAKALRYALTQFQGINSVYLSVDGIPLTVPGRAASIKDPLDVVGPGPPRVLGVVGIPFDPRQRLESIAVYFDRPVTLQHLSLTDEAGHSISGNISVSRFNMVAQIQTSALASLQEGAGVRVAWQVVDALDTASSGERTFHVVRHLHP